MCYTALYHYQHCRHSNVAYVVCDDNHGHTDVKSSAHSHDSSCPRCSIALTRALSAQIQESINAMSGLHRASTVAWNQFAGRALTATSDQPAPSLYPHQPALTRTPRPSLPDWYLPGLPPAKQVVDLLEEVQALDAALVIEQQTGRILEKSRAEMEAEREDLKELIGWRLQLTESIQKDEAEYWPNGVDETNHQHVVPLAVAIGRTPAANEVKQSRFCNDSTTLTTKTSEYLVYFAGCGHYLGVFLKSLVSTASAPAQCGCRFPTDLTANRCGESLERCLLCRKGFPSPGKAEAFGRAVRVVQTKREVQLWPQAARQLGWNGLAR